MLYNSFHRDLLDGVGIRDEMHMLRCYVVFYRWTQY